MAKKIILQIEKNDALKLVEILKKGRPSDWGEDWFTSRKFVGQIREQIEAQSNGKFFQCEACYDSQSR